MNIDKDYNSTFDPDELHQPGDEDILPSDDDLAVQFGDPKLMGDEFLAMAEEALTCGTKRELTYWIAEQLRGFKVWKLTAARLIEASATRQRKLEALRQAIVELTSQTHNNSTCK